MAQKSLADQLKLAEDKELEAAASGILLPVDAYVNHLLLLLINGELVNARHLWKRVPSEHVKSTQLAAVHGVLAGLWKKDWALVNKSLAANLSNALWPELAARVRRQQVVLLGKAYAVVHTSTAARVLGCTEQEAAQQLTSAHWTQEQGGHFAAPAAASAANDNNQATDLQQLQQLTQYLVFLEKKA